ncbi:hypothetical protein [Thiobacillus sp.]|uniref:hypothetical protein n=1 Tax=Thiobacillus sp. TaxID=924 RepID=UPI0011DC1556|nr:hypothetical protein [Thiobacillus sp.]TXH76399.1 MAG: hypothetical protein E6Q82_03320 [Thiobacillus sp.]
MALTTFHNTGIQYAADFFAEDTIALMLQPPQALTLEEMVMGVAAPPDTPEAAIAAAWAELADDADFQKAVSEKNFTEAQATATLASSIAAPMGATLDAKLADMLKVNYETRVENGNYVYLLDGERILTISGSMDSAPMVAANADAILYGCFLVIDVLGIVAAAASVSVAVQKSKMAKSLQGPLGGFFKKVMNPTAVRELKRLEQLGEKLELIKKVLFWLRGTTNLKTVVGTFLQSLSWIDYAVAIIQLVASVLLLIGTGGATMAAKIMQLGAAIAMFLADLVGFIRALTKQAQPG